LYFVNVTSATFNIIPSFIKVLKTVTLCGCLLLVNNLSAQFSDDCNGGNGILHPTTETGPTGHGFDCAKGTLEFASPEMINSLPGDLCHFDENPTVWIRVEIDSLAAQIFSSVTTEGSWTPIWSMYAGDDCDNLIQLGGFGVPFCSNNDNTPDLHQLAIEGHFNVYWLAVSGEGNIDDPNFELCVATSANAIICLGGFGQECGEDAFISVVDRENEGSLDGPFCPGEQLTVCVDFFYDASESAGDGLMGIVPIFGNAWDKISFDPIMNSPSGASWIDYRDSCAAILQEAVPHLFTFYDEEGALQLDNGLCYEDCPDLGMEVGDTIPSGWFWLTEGLNPACENTCQPGESWGIGSITAQINFCLDLKVKDHVSTLDCMNHDDLQIGFQTFSQGLVGCWEDPIGECLLDFAQYGPSWIVACPIIAYDTLYAISTDFPIDYQGEIVNQFGDTLITLIDGGAFGCDSLINLSILINTSTEDIGFGDMVSPNPTTDFVFFSEELYGRSYNLYNSSGQKLESGKLTELLRVGRFTPGVYYLQVILDKSRLSYFKILKL
jgi:hypothetical protein